MHHMLEGTDKVPGLRKIKNLNACFDNPDLTKRDFILAITYDNIELSAAVGEFVKRSVIVFVRNAKSYYSARPLEPYGLPGIIRVSPFHCHSFDEVERFLKVSAEIAAL